MRAAAEQRKRERFFAVSFDQAEAMAGVPLDLQGAWLAISVHLFRLAITTGGPFSERGILKGVRLTTGAWAFQRITAGLDRPILNRLVSAGLAVWEGNDLRLVGFPGVRP